jgi:hypothetical protein
MRVGNGTQRRGNFLGAIVRNHPLPHRLVHRVELRDFNQNRRNGGCTPGHKLQIAERDEERRAAAVGVGPPFAGLKPERIEEARQLVEHVARSHWRDQCDSLDHVIDCIVWVA